MEDNKTYYNKFCKKNELPIFFQPWWLDSTAGKNNWGVAIYEKSNEVFGVLPFFFKNKAIFKFLGLPTFSQHLGPWLIYPKGQKNNTKLAFEKEVLTNLINLLPKANVSVLKAHHSIQNILPFVWKGFDSTVKYTYILKDILNNEAGLLENLSSGTRKNIKKAQKIVEVIESEDASELFGLIQKTFNRQRMKVPFNEAQLLNLYNSCVKKNSCKILLAKDKQNNIHSGILLIWNNKTVYYLMGGSNPNFRNSEAMSLVMWESIKFASSFAREFDFEGTMVESIERFIRGFGGIQKPYYQLSKVRPKFLKPLYEIRYSLS